jgi:cytochrome c1
MKNYSANKVMKHILFLALAGLFPLLAAANEVKLDESELPTDRAAMLRGAQEVATTCNACHGLKYIKYRDLLSLGLESAKVDELRGAQPLDAVLQAQMPADAARASFNGVVPPDLSLMAAAREGGGHYLYSYLTGYHNNEKGELVNSVFPGTQMPDILGIAGAADAQARSEISNKAKDISAFLIWAADPHAAERRTLGYYVLGYVLIMTILLWVWKKRIWRDIDRKPKIR